MKAQRHGEVRTRSPSEKIRDQRSEWRRDPYLPPLGNSREQRPSRSRRSLSPPELNISRRVLGGDRRSTSVERRDYGMHSDGVRDVHFRSRSPTFEQTLNRSQFNEGFPTGEGFPSRDTHSIEYRRKYLLPDIKDLNDASNPNLKYIGSSGPSASRIAREKNFQSVNSSTLDGHGMLVQKSTYLDDGSAQKFFTLHPDIRLTVNSGKIGGNFPPQSGNLNIEDEELQYRDNVHPNKILARESYTEEENPMFYPRDVSDQMMALTRSKAFGSTSSGLSKDDILSSFQDSLPLSSDGFGRKGVKFINPFQAPPFDSVRDPNLCSKDLTSYQTDPLSPARGEPRDYSYPEFGRSERSNRTYLPDELYREMQLSTRGDYAIRSSLRPGVVGPTVDRIDGPESSRRNLRESGLWEQHSLQGEPVPNYMDVRRASQTRERDEELLGSGRTHFTFGMDVSRDHEIIHPEGDFGFGRDAGPWSYKETLKSSMKSECDPDMYRLDVSPKWRLKAEKLRIYDPSDRTLKRKYAIDEEMSRHNPRSLSTSTRNTSRQVQELSSEEQWTGEDPDGLLSSKRLNYGRLQYRKSGRPYDDMVARRLSTSSDWLSSHDQSAHVQGHAVRHYTSGGGDLNIKRRLKPAPFHFHNSYPLDRRQDYYKTYKFWKRNQDDRYGGVNIHNGAPLEEWCPPVKSDLSEDSEQFKQLVHTAFLRFSKQLNENPGLRKKYREQGKAGTLLCIVCGSLSKIFADTRSLVTHSFMSLKVGLRADHLGLHKALCVLMGWNTDVDPDSTWVHQVLPETEALSMKEDLILWPPLVIIHNSSIGNNNPDERKVVTIEGMEAILRDMGFSGGKTKVLRGKPANQSIMVAKFMPTFSGLQEAERLHKYYTENKRGREEFQQVTANNGNGNGGAGGNDAEKAELVLYGYMGIAEDLDKLDYETKKRCLVKSKKDIQAIADAPLRDD